jgi:hypothetical protein
MNRPASRKGYEFNVLSYAVIGACQDVQRQLGVHTRVVAGYSYWQISARDR